MLADPAAGDQLFPGADGEARMGGGLVAAAVVAGVAEQDRVALRPAQREARRREEGLAAFIAVAQPDQAGEDPLVVEAGDRVEMGAILVAGLVAQHLQRLPALDAGAARRG